MGEDSFRPVDIGNGAGLFLALKEGGENGVQIAKQYNDETNEGHPDDQQGGNP